MPSFDGVFDEELRVAIRASCGLGDDIEDREYDHDQADEVENTVHANRLLYMFGHQRSGGDHRRIKID
ncbi:MAG: hypothetical protein AAGF53_18845 [Pseudomonadota bacterium]